MSDILTLPLVAKPAPDSHYEWEIDDGSGVKVAEVLAWDDAREPLPAEARAKHIVQAVNAHPALLAALKQLLAWADSAGLAEVLAGRHSENCGCAEPIEAAHAALALAEAQP